MNTATVAPLSQEPVGVPTTVGVVSLLRLPANGSEIAGVPGATLSTVIVRVGPSVVPFTLLARAYNVWLPCVSALLAQLNIPLLQVVLHRVVEPSRTAMLLPFSQLPNTVGVVVVTYDPALGTLITAAAGGGRLTVKSDMRLYPVFPATSVW